MQLHYTNFGIELDFNPLIEAHGLKGNYVLQHWAARPKFLRTWGYLWVRDGGAATEQSKYLSIPAQQIEILTLPRVIDVDERAVKTVPTACLLYENSLLIKEQGHFKIKKQ